MLEVVYDVLRVDLLAWSVDVSSRVTVDVVRQRGGGSDLHDETATFWWLLFVNGRTEFVSIMIIPLLMMNV